jgi:hypothetical protein
VRVCVRVCVCLCITADWPLDLGCCELAVFALLNIVWTDASHASTMLAEGLAARVREALSRFADSKVERPCGLAA